MNINTVLLGALIGSILYGVSVMKITFYNCLYTPREQEDLFLEHEVKLIELEKRNLRISDDLRDLSERILLKLE